MDATQKLIQFMESVNRRTDAEIARAQAKTETSAARLVQEAQTKCAANAEQEIAAAKAQIDARYQKKLAQVGYRGKTALLSCRQNLLGQLFADLREKLVAFTASPEYTEWMQSLLRAQQPEENAVILLREADLPMQDVLAKAAGVPVQFATDATILLGGLSVQAADGKSCSNHTLDEAFDVQYRNFYRNHKLDGGEA